MPTIFAQILSNCIIASICDFHIIASLHRLSISVCICISVSLCTKRTLSSVVEFSYEELLRISNEEFVWISYKKSIQIINSLFRVFKDSVFVWKI